ncbi:PH domain-containing protein [Streptomyces sp. BHT-5-2]|uniref:PH domain-containing protein n=1 Tax=unclassified Streptomyces TaxID=2593676 RepID=UPI001C8E3B50|nr:PH domain-containing protein [Streptomyces sp. BHT-5-2]QZL05290.1 PH domain-containing protein [Streptomyces sp. BHT-5-2]
MTTPYYQDRWITCTPDALRVRGYYFPWGTKTIPYTAIRSVRRVEMGALTGQGRIWGTGHPRYWASLDPRRMSKTTAFVLDLGRRVRPFLTPDDPDAVAAVLRERVPPGAVVEGGGRR